MRISGVLAILSWMLPAVAQAQAPKPTGLPTENVTVIAPSPLPETVLRDFVKSRYSSWDSGIGQQIEGGKADFAALEKYMLDKGEAAANVSGRQELLENVINRYLR